MQQKLEKTLEKLISIRSISSDSAACREIIELAGRELETLGLYTEWHTNTTHPWVYASTQATRTPHVLLVAHLDVVPAPETLFTLAKQDGRLLGRGVFDMKFAAACYIELFRDHAELRKKNIGILFTTDEELGGHSMTEVLASGIRPKVAFIPDGGDNWSIEKRAKGLHTIEILSVGKSAHGSRPWEGESALHTLLDISHILRAKYPSDKPSGATLSINQLRSGAAINQVPEHASMGIDFRTFSKQELEDFKLLIAELSRIHTLQIIPVNTGDPLLFDEKHPQVQGFLQVLEQQTGKEVFYCESYGASDARFFAEYNIPCIVIEPNGGGRHSNEEWLQASDLEKYYHLIEQWLATLLPQFTVPLAVEKAPAEPTTTV